MFHLYSDRASFTSYMTDVPENCVAGKTIFLEKRRITPGSFCAFRGKSSIGLSGS